MKTKSDEKLKWKMKRKALARLLKASGELFYAEMNYRYGDIYRKHR